MSDPEDPSRYGEPAKPRPSCLGCESTGWFGSCPHTAREDEPMSEEQSDSDFVRGLLWGEHPECCGVPVVGAEYMGQQEQVCCGCPEPALLNDAQIVATLRARFPDV